MTLEEFKKIEGNFFSINDNWGDINKVSIDLVKCLIQIEKTLNKKIYISNEENSVYDPNKNNVYHNLGIAADIFVDCNPIEFLIKTISIKEIGAIGFNFNKSFKKFNLNCSYHIDIRNTQNKKIWFIDKNENFYDLKTSKDYEKFLDCIYENIFLKNKIKN